MDDVLPHYVMYNAKKSDLHNPFKQDLSLFDNVVTKVVGTSPFNIDGNKIYQIKCDEYTWKEKLNNGRHWQVNWGKTGDLTLKDVYQNVKDRLCVLMISVLCSKCTILLMKLHFPGVLWKDPTSVQNACNILKDNGVVHLELLNGIMTPSYSLFGIRVSTYVF